MKIQTVRHILTALLLSATAQAYAFEGILTMQTTRHSGSAIPGMDQAQLTQMQDAMKMMESQMANLTPEQRAMIQKNMPGAQNTAQPEKEINTTNIYLKSGMVKVVDTDKDNPEAIIKQEKITLVEHPKKTYTEITKAELEKMMQSVMATIPKEFQNQAKPKPATPAPTVKPDVKKTGKTMMVAGYKCEEWVATSGKEKTELWISPEFADVYQQFAEMEKTMRNMAKQFGHEPQDLQYTALTEIKGVPMKTIHYADGKVTEEMEVTKVDKKALSESDFQPPASYKKTDFMAGMPK